MIPASPELISQSSDAMSSPSSDGESIAPSQSEKRESVRQSGRFHRSKRQMFFAPLCALLDILIWVIAYFILSRVTGWYNVITPAAIFLPLVILLLSLALVGGYKVRMDFASLRYASEHLIACAFALAVAALLLYVVASFGPNPTSSRAIFTTTFFIFAVFSLFFRRTFWFWAATFRAEGKFLVIADDRFGAVFYRDYQSSGQYQGVRYVAADKKLRGKPIAGEGTPAPIVEAAHLLPHLDKETAAGYEAIVLAADLDRLDPEIARRLAVIHFEELPVYTMESFYENYWVRIPLELLGPAWPIETEFVLVQHSVYSALKRLLDFVFVLFLLLLVAPIMLVTALAIMILDGFPIIYSQPRAGIHGEPFTLYKFRTMRVGSDRGDGYTREGDSRVSKFGNFLRKTRLDELPQLWNVLRGDMSMIGPRAEWMRLVSDYERQIPHYHFRHLVRPGITGWAQVHYPYGASLEDTLQKFSYDLYYIRNFSMKLDAEVLLKTLHVVLFGKGR